MSLMRQQTVVAGVILVDVHSMDDCAGLPCAIHNPTGHNLSNWPLILRTNTTEVLDRICPHGPSTIPTLTNSLTGPHTDWKRVPCTTATAAAGRTNRIRTLP